jgi:pimeloyl-ACP methyl ester carboxylesterase
MSYQSAVVTTPDGRQLEVGAVGDVRGPTVFFHPGTPGSAPLIKSFEKDAIARGYFVVTTSRAGYGPSTRVEGRSAASVVADVTVALDHCGRDRYVGLGWSGGGPTSSRAPRWISRGASRPFLSPVSPLRTRDSTGPKVWDPRTWKSSPWHKPVDPSTKRISNSNMTFLPKRRTTTSLNCLAGFCRTSTRSCLMILKNAPISLKCAVTPRRGHFGFIDDDQVFMHDWGFDPASIQIPVEVWYGNHDLMVPPTHGDHLSSTIPGAVRFHQPHDGHISVVANHREHLFDQVGSYLR